MQRLRDERGAVAVTVALLMIPLIGFAAMAINVSAMWAEKNQLQNGADAGALAIAQACVHNEPCTNASATATAQGYAVSNRNSGTATGKAEVESTAGKVTVTASDPHEDWFAGLLDPDGESAVNAKATAEWGWPTRGATLPLTFSKCEFSQQVSLDSTEEDTILFSKTADSTGCGKGPSGNFLPGGFAWVDTTGSCTQNSSILGSGTWLDSDTGNTPSAGCGTADFAKMLNKVILIPLFDDATGNGTKGTYHVVGYAAFKMTGYNFGGSFKTSPAACDSNDRCVKGYFTRYADLNEALDFGPTGGQFGAAIVTLTD